ncbi:GUN4 domain-containing protein [Microcoleus sp. AT3-D2]|uniref:GUN4 domain-containing protein n=1 Tax=Microcoleus sp. AT3-D2 TaxID=2818612 RepID=UPI002FD24B50
MGILIGLAIAIAAFVTLVNIYEYKSQASTNTLRDLLASGKWREANKETERLLAVTTNRAMGLPRNQERYRLNPKTLQRCIPCSILRTVDQLWVQYSDGRFGFSIQLGILEECKKADDWKKKEVQEFDRINSSGYGIQGGRVHSYFQGYGFSPLADPVELVILWERLGWITRGYTDGRYTYFNRDIPDLNYSLSAPKGQLPVYDHGTTLYDIHTLSILQRLKDCGHSVTSIPQPLSPYPQSPFFNPNSQPPSIDQPPGLDQPPGPDYPFL